MTSLRSRTTPVEILPDKIQRENSTGDYKLSSLINITSSNKIILSKQRDCYEIRLDKHGFLWILMYSAAESENLVKLDLKKKTCTVFYSTLFDGPLGLAFSPFDESILFSCQGSNRVFKLNEASSTISEITGINRVGQVRGMDFDSKHNLYIIEFATQQNSPLYKFNCSAGLDKVTLDEKLMPPIQGYACTVRVHPRTDEVYASYYNPSTIHKIVNDQFVQTYQMVATKQGEVRIGASNGMCFYEDLLLVADQKRGVIRVIDLKTGIAETLDIKLPNVNSLTVDPIAQVLYAANETTIWELGFTSKMSKRLFVRFPRIHYVDILIFAAK